MNKRFFLYFFSILSISFSNAFSAIPVKYDTSEIKVRIPEGSAITKIKRDKDFNYKLAPTPDESFLEWLKYKFYKILDIIFSDKGPAIVIRWILVIAILIFILLKILKVTPQSLFYKNKKSQVLPSGEFSEDITGLNFEALIIEASAEGNYKKAVRYMYLKLLKILSEQNIIEWSVYKTNQDYHKEMLSSSFNENFRKLSSLFEFTWYGDFTLNAATFKKIHYEFSEFYNRLNK